MNDDAFDLSGQVAVVTGAGTGVGKAAAILLARHGADVVAAGRTPSSLDATLDEVRSLGRRSLAVVTDVSRPDDCVRLIEATITELQGIDILVNSAGEWQSRPLDHWDANSWHAMLDLNLRSVFLLSQLASRHMLAQGRGVIVSVSPDTGEIGEPSSTRHGAVKAGLSSLTRAFAAAWGPHGVRVNCVAMGTLRSEGGSAPMEPNGALNSASIRNALGRAGTAEEIAYPILFCVSRAASFMTGETITIAGGPAAPELG
jgi:NAD(P)-dependent dehydrogenase (short-subunit alcohol dehydrogenase family)